MIEKIITFKVICDGCGKSVIVNGPFRDLYYDLKIGIVNAGWLFSTDCDNEIAVIVCDDCKKNIHGPLEADNVNWHHRSYK